MPLWSYKKSDILIINSVLSKVKSYPHGSKSSGIEPMTRQSIEQHRPPYVHGVCALTYNYTILWQCLVQIMENRIVIQRGCRICRHSLKQRTKNIFPSKKIAQYIPEQFSCYPDIFCEVCSTIRPDHWRQSYSSWVLARSGRLLVSCHSELPPQTWHYCGALQRKHQFVWLWHQGKTFGDGRNAGSSSDGLPGEESHLPSAKPKTYDKKISKTLNYIQKWYSLPCRSYTLRRSIRDNPLAHRCS